ncbi:MAG: hypothetical protein ACFBSE_21630, partial [Prochloraceae cyanobacterium]
TKITKNLSLNLGIASIKPRTIDHCEQLLIAAEEALEKAKTIGKNCKIIKDISHSELKINSQLPNDNPQPIKQQLSPASLVRLNSDIKAKKVSQPIDRKTLKIS